MSIHKFLDPRSRALLALGLPPIPANGGDSDSQANTTTTNNTTNTAYNTDKRSVASEEAVSLTGDGNMVDRSSTTNFADSSNRSTTFIDGSNRSTNFSDSSNRSTNFHDSSKRDSENIVGSYNSTSIQTTDFGSVGKSLDSLSAMTKRALEVADSSVLGAIGSANKAAGDNFKLIEGMFNMASLTSANAITSSREVLGFANKAITETQGAFAEAKHGPDKRVLIAAAVVIGLVGVAAVWKK